MRRQALQFFAVARQTGLETIRSSSVLGVACGCLVLHAVLPMTVSHTLGESGRMMADASLAIHWLGGLLLGGFAASAGGAGGLRGAAVASILTKPVSPSLFYLAKSAGIAGVLFVFSLTATAAGLLGARAAAEDYAFDPWAAGPLLAAPALACLVAGALNYAARRPFGSTAFSWMIVSTAGAFVVGATLDGAGRPMAFGALYSLPLAQAHGLVAISVLLLAALALALSSRWGTIPVLTLCGAVFLAGLASDALFGRYAETGGAAAWLIRCVPNGQVFWTMDALHEGRLLSARYMAEASLYGGLWGVALLFFGLALFRHAEIRSG